MRIECIRVIRDQCRSLAVMYQQRQEELLSRIFDATGEKVIDLSAKLAAYDLASCTIERLCGIITDCYYERPSEEQALRMILDELTGEVLTLGSVKAQTRG